jgi:transcriptional regulator with XRE-family HTH domain
MKFDEDLLRERILRLIHREGISQRAFAITLGMPPSNINKILTGERHIPKGFEESILTAFPTTGTGRRARRCLTTSSRKSLIGSI